MSRGLPPATALRGPGGRKRSSERKQSKQELELYRLMVESATDYAIFRLDPQGHITSWNVGAERIKGYKPKEIIGRHFSVFYPPDIVEAGYPEYELEVAAREGRFEDEGWRLRKDGSRFWANVVITALRDERGRLVGYSKITRDLTERKRAEEEIRQLADTLERRVRERTHELEEANRDLEAYTYSVSHDLRAPLRAMQGLAQALLEDRGEQLDHIGLDYVRRIAGAGKRMDTLVQDLLAYSRLRRSQVKPRLISLSAAVDKALAEAAAQLEEREARVTVSDGLPDALGDQTILTQVLINLLTNAAKFVAPGMRPHVQIWAEESGEYVRLWVADNGIGIAEQDRERIWGVFERLHGVDRYPGTGIGLATVLRGVERMGGHVGMQSDPGHGSRFWVELPRGVSVAG